MEDNGFSVTVKNTQDMGPIKIKYQIPPELQSCHTAIVDGYVIEGHVPVREINRLLQERPKMIGLAVAGMPIDSPGMDAAGAPAQRYDVVAFNVHGKQEIYASYP